VSHGDAFAGLGQVKQYLAGFSVGNDGAHGYAQGDVGGAGAVLLAPAPVFTCLATVDATVLVVDKRVDIAVCHHMDTGAAPTVASVRSAAWNIFFAAKAGDAIAAFAGNDINGGFVNEL